VADRAVTDTGMINIRGNRKSGAAAMAGTLPDRGAAGLHGFM